MYPSAVPSMPGFGTRRDSWAHRVAGGFRKSHIAGHDRLPDAYNLEATTASARSLDTGSTAADRTWPGSASPLQSSPSSPAFQWSRPASALPTTTRSATRPKSALPTFVADDKIVLRFFGYFREPVHWDQGPLGVGDKESNRIRRCAMTINVLENSLQVHERTKRNAGVLGGAFYKGRLPTRKDGSQVTITDFQVGGEVELLNRIMYICDADKPTREYFRRRLGVVMGPSFPVPDGGEPESFTAESATGLGVQRRPATAYKSEEQRIREAELQKAARFLKFDRKVLRFFGILKSEYDSGMGVKHDSPRFSLMYYLADGTIETLILARTGTQTTTTLLLKRCRLAKNWRAVRNHEEPKYVTDADLRVGEAVDVFGREIVLLSCDEFTKTYYKDTHNIDQNEIILPTRPTPVYNQGTEGTEGGSLEIGAGQRGAMTIKPGTKGQTLRCRMQIDTNDRIDASRKFVLTFYVQDGTVQIFEETIKNSGILGGNYVNRGRYLNKRPPEGGPARPLRATDVFVGAILELSVGKRMKVLEMDGSCMRYCEQRPQEFPLFDISRILAKVATAAKTARLDLRVLFAPHDPHHRGLVENGQRFLSVLERNLAIKDLVEQERIVLLRAFSTNPIDPDAAVQYQDFCDRVAAVAIQQGVATAVNSITHGMTAQNPRLREVFRQLDSSTNGTIPLDQLLLACNEAKIDLNDNITDHIRHHFTGPTNGNSQPPLVEYNALCDSIYQCDWASRS